MTHQICDECETVAYCMKSGCVPKQPQQQDEAWKTEQKALADEAVKCAIEALSDPNHPATIAAREYYNTTHSKEKHMKLQQLLDQTPRLRAWAAIGPVQRAELEQFAQAVLDSCAVGVTADGYFAEHGDRVWILNGVGTPTQTTVEKTQAVTRYQLFGPVPVAHSWMDRQELERYRREL